VDVVNEWSLCRARHIVNDDVWLGRKPLKEIGELVQRGNLPAIINADG
jgi:hypothetical protein